MHSGKKFENSKSQYLYTRIYKIEKKLFKLTIFFTLHCNFEGNEFSSLLTNELDRLSWKT